MALITTVQLFTLGYVANVVLGGDTCWTASGAADCQQGCCSASGGLEECCNFPTVALVFAVIGTSVLISICVVLVRCAFQKKKGNTGQQNQPRGQRTISTVDARTGPSPDNLSSYQQPMSTDPTPASPLYYQRFRY